MENKKNGFLTNDNNLLSYFPDQVVVSESVQNFNSE